MRRFAKPRLGETLRRFNPCIFRQRYTVGMLNPVQFAKTQVSKRANSAWDKLALKVLGGYTDPVQIYGTPLPREVVERDQARVAKR